MGRVTASGKIDEPQRIAAYILKGQKLFAAKKYAGVPTVTFDGNTLVSGGAKRGDGTMVPSCAKRLQG